MKIKKIILILIFIGLFTCLNPVYAVNFSDTSKHWAKEEINIITNQKLMSGYEDGTFRPNSKITKAEFYVVVNNLASLQKTYTVTFSDVSTSDWYYNDIAKAIKAGYLTPTTGKLHPNRPITREEVSDILGYIYGFKESPTGVNSFSDAKEISEEKKGYVGALVKIGAINGYPDGRFAPKESITRAEIASILSKLTSKYNRPGSKVVMDSKIKFGRRNLYD